MITVEEDFGGTSLSYTLKDEEGTIEIVSTSCVMKTLNEIDTYVFRDYNMNILLDPSCFVTDELRWESANTVSQAVSAMKALSNYCAITRTPFRAFDTSQARSFLMFLRGTLSDGIIYKFQLVTQRSEETISAYLKHIRRYARYLNIGNSPFLQPNRSLSRASSLGGRQDTTHRIKADVSPTMEAPRYISIDEYRRILSVIDKDWTAEEKCIVRLMYEHGLRIGEVLGLTTEDLEWNEGKNGEPSYAIVLRNRKSDRTDQHAKTLMKIFDEQQYRSPDYRKRNYGFQRVYISDDLFFALTEYAESTLNDTTGQNQADSVKKDGKDNQYLFVNTLGRPLSSNLWNKRLRKIMADAGIKTDKETRKTNLNHRFRHGYAMALIRTAKANGKPLDDFAIMTLMRHKSLSSTQVYHRPTEQDVQQMQEEVITSILEEIHSEQPTDDD